MPHMHRVLIVHCRSPFSAKTSRRSVSYLKGLSPAQLRAVEHDPSVPLQILAGPGSGKTKVLTSRIAHLIDHHGLPPSSICAVTFTNRAAQELRHRLTGLLGEYKTAEIEMGTFHAICARNLRRYGQSVGLEKNFTVCDEEISKKIIMKLLKQYQEEDPPLYTFLKDNIVSWISTAKAKGHTEAVLLKVLSQSRWELHASDDSDARSWQVLEEMVLAIYRDYEKTLRNDNSVDFDDLITYGVRLFRKSHKVGQWCQHVLVDEFQDTSVMQYYFMKHIAAPSGCITVVGDPDQSIYGWRAAEVKSLAWMQEDFPSTQQVILEENYRSSGSIVDTTHHIIAEDKNRIPKSLRAIHPRGPTPVLIDFPTGRDEAMWIAVEIERLVASSGGLLRWSDFAVLLRKKSHSHAIESALRTQGIPCRVLAGLKFFDRPEVKDILAYLQLLDNPRFVPAFMRVINVPARDIGDKSIQALLSQAEHLNISPLELAERIHDGATPDIKPPVRRKVASFVDMIRKLRDLANDLTLPANLIRKLLELSNYKVYLQKMHSDDWESPWEDVQELIKFANGIERWLLSTALYRLDSSQVAQSIKTTDLEDTPLRLFLHASVLSPDIERESDEDSKNKVTITTCHTAKGLE